MLIFDTFMNHVKLGFRGGINICVDDEDIGIAFGDKFYQFNRFTDQELYERIKIIAFSLLMPMDNILADYWRNITF